MDTQPRRHGRPHQAGRPRPCRRDSGPGAPASPPDRLVSRQPASAGLSQAATPSPATSQAGAAPSAAAARTSANLADVVAIRPALVGDAASAAGTSAEARTTQTAAAARAGDVADIIGKPRPAVHGCASAGTRGAGQKCADIAGLRLPVSYAPGRCRPVRRRARRCVSRGASAARSEQPAGSVHVPAYPATCFTVGQASPSAACQPPCVTPCSSVTAASVPPAAFAVAWCRSTEPDESRIVRRAPDRLLLTRLVFTGHVCMKAC